MSGSRARLPEIGMNESDCSALIESVNWRTPESILSLIALMCIDVIVISGNTMVILAVYFTSKLRSVTNLFIVSLAVADLMVGVAVLPFSAVWEVFKVRFPVSLSSTTFEMLRNPFCKELKCYRNLASSDFKKGWLWNFRWSRSGTGRQAGTLCVSSLPVRVRDVSLMPTRRAYFENWYRTGTKKMQIGTVFGCLFVFPLIRNIFLVGVPQTV